MENNFKNKYDNTKKQITFDEWIISLNKEADQIIQKMKEADQEMGIEN